ncbi:aminotransferase class V-fold PLP-dependent enzyme [Paramaledivibacter caminithermalis]|jgi:selenocysteine lyase/cysteine desulfurase|uniref:Selenocysteine lyase/Cysteine desulfurase n=1 Tax=Paramaledivibacter caminithermalis (strain DSM 15212 / CIP 107654 / DViRD3) TaxID=1121301 RepID=A0A1M6P3K4_PARC5|nr:aminotransferase class V-fold PLP-dependent enzyme [Paramaledivibacter caminithermalis]SHK02545.1 Selenocysteine lyase/Cysteine desulfurase [Paramaledivibacter caminithermalis DSM 15212]
MLYNEFKFKKRYFNCGSVGIIPRSSIKKIHKNMEDESSNPTGKKICERLISVYYDVKKEMGTFLNVNYDNLAYVQSTNVGIGTILASFHWNDGDEVIIGNNEYIDGILPFLALQKKFGVKIRVVNSSNLINEINSVMNDKVKMVFVSHIECSTGVEHDIIRLCREVENRENIKIMIDGAQAVGQIDLIGLENVDFYIFPFHKWMLGPMGTGMVYIGDRQIEQLCPITLSSIGGEITTDNDIVLKSKAMRIENSSFNFSMYSAILNNLNLMKGIEIQRIYQTIEELAEYFAQKAVKLKGIEEGTVYQNNGMVFIYFPKEIDVEYLRKKLEESECICRTFREKNCLRFCFHIYNSKEDIDVLCSALERVIGAVTNKERTNINSNIC